MRVVRAHRRPLVALAWVVGVLQGCSGADAVAPRAGDTATVPASPTLPAPEPSNLRAATDTAVVGGTLVIAGDALPTDPATIRATLAGVPLPLESASATALTFRVPAAFPCRAAVAEALDVRAGAATLVTTVPLRAAERVTLARGETRTVPDVNGTVCLELTGTGTGSSTGTGADASSQYVLAVVNTAPTASSAPSYTLTGTGTGLFAGRPSAVRAAPSALVSGGAPSALAALPRESGDLPAHAARLRANAAMAHQAPNALSLWRQRAAMGASRGATLRLALSEGDTTVLGAIGGSCARATAVRARVVYAGSRATVLEDVAAPRAGSMDAVYRAIGDEYDRVVHPLLDANVGSPLAMDQQMGGTGRVTLLFTRFVNDSMPGTAGFVSACNFYPRSTFAASNEAPVVYARVPSLAETPADWRRTMRSTVVHEAKHLASFAERLARGRDFEEPWLEEATARVAEELYARTFTPGMAWRSNTGFAASVQCEITACDDRPLVMWKHFNGLHAWLRSASTTTVGQLTGESGAALSATAANAAYASGWALVRFMLDRYATSEGDALRQLVAGERGVGLDALANVARASGQTLLAEFAVNVAADAGLRDGSSPVSPASWSYRDIIGGMATMFPGVFSAQPLSATHREAGDFAVAAAVQGTAHYTTLQGDFARGGQVLQVTAAHPGTIGVAIRRAQ